MAVTDGSDIAWGIAITFSSGLLAEITDVKHADMGKRNVAKFVHAALTNGYVRKVPSDVIDAGRLTVTCFFETQRLSAYKTAWAAASASVVVTWPVPVTGGVTAGTMTVPGFCTNMSVAMPLEDGMTIDVDLELHGEPVMVNAA